MPKGCLVGLGFIGGVVAGYLTCFLAYLFWTVMLGGFDREGGWAMGLAFGIGPFVALLSGVAAALWIGLRKRGRAD
ncbi:hypothetical protein [Sphingomonas sp. ERG5]|uniref:hypothetical protein n=1 Tax=Sphingomonas sp. ERG5 TaxID=1381597 RepID=UPI00054B9C59|nr:hypothetical protein [Sphingomonas sp. ERG5]